MFGAVRAPRVYEHIVAQIERAIYEGRFAHGDKLPPERQLVREFGASRVAVREALRALEHRGLVEVRQGSAGGYFIRRLDALPPVRGRRTTPPSSPRISRSTTRSLAATATPRARPCTRTSWMSSAGSPVASSHARRPDPREAPMSARRAVAALAAAVTLVAAAPCAAQAPIRIGEVNSFSGIGAPFTGPYRQAIEMAVEEVNGRGGVPGRKVEGAFRGVKGEPAG